MSRNPVAIGSWLGVVLVFSTAYAGEVPLQPTVDSVLPVARIDSGNVSSRSAAACCEEVMSQALLKQRVDPRFADEVDSDQDLSHAGGPATGDVRSTQGRVLSAAGPFAGSLSLVALHTRLNC